MLTTFIFSSLGGMLLGYLVFRVIFSLIPSKLRQSSEKQKAEVLKEAMNHAHRIKLDGEKNLESSLNSYQEGLDEELLEEKEDLDILEKEIAAHEELANQEEQRVEKVAAESERTKQKVEKLSQKLSTLQEGMATEHNNLILALTNAAKISGDELRNQIKNDLITERQIQTQKLLKKITDELDSSQRRLAERMLSRVLSRYTPVFKWPKVLTHVECGDDKIFSIVTDSIDVVSNLGKLAGIEAEVLGIDQQGPRIIKLAGGFGLNREALRLSLENALKVADTKLDEGRLVNSFKNYQNRLEAYSLDLGQLACKNLGLEDLHPQIKRLIGCLNWRTSYRQNQFLHSFEVSVLAGLLATELKVDPIAAKRSGILHDIGKALDFNIEGSHAVISADYADRYGEKRYICDTVMSHHNDLLLETPLSFVLKAADTLSGARPGARVNLEAGYHGRLTGIDEAVSSFEGVIRASIMNGGKEVHVDVNYKKVRVDELEELTHKIAQKISEDVAFPGQIKVQVSRKFEYVAVA